MALTVVFDLARVAWGIKFQTYCDLKLLLALGSINPSNSMLDPFVTYTFIVGEKEGVSLAASDSGDPISSDVSPLRGQSNSLVTMFQTRIISISWLSY